MLDPLLHARRLLVRQWYEIARIEKPFRWYRFL